MNNTSVQAPSNPANSAAARPVGVAVALAVIAVVGVGHAYWRNASTWSDRETPAALGLSSQAAGLRLNDVYLAEQQSSRVRGQVSAELVASMVVDSGPSDRLLSVRVAGRPATLLDSSGTQTRSGLPVSASAPLDAQPAAHDPQVRVTLPAADARSTATVPVTFVFAVRGPVTASAPVWPSVNWPNATQRPGASAQVHRTA